MRTSANHAGSLLIDGGASAASAASAHAAASASAHAAASAHVSAAAHAAASAAHADGRVAEPRAVDVQAKVLSALRNVGFLETECGM